MRTAVAGAPSESGGAGEVYPEPVAAALVAAGHFGAGVAEVLLDVPLVGLSGRGKAGAQRVPGKQRQTPVFGQIGADAGLKHGLA